MAGDAIGQIKCDACDGTADIFKRGNSKTMLYMRCQCGRYDMGNAAPKLQAKWRAAVESPNSPDDWKPTKDTQSTDSAALVKNELENELEPEVKNGFKKWAVAGGVVLVVGLGLFGVRVKA